MTTENKSHAKYSASSSKRWLACPGSIKLSESAPPPRDSAYSKEGTTAHECLELLLRNPARQLQMSADLAKKHGAQMLAHVEAAVKEIYKLRPKGAEMLIEVKSDLDFIEPDMGGTTDVAILEDFGTLTIIDFKYGAGIPVEAQHNTQMICYALGIAHKHHYNFEDVQLVIIQPRAPHEDGPVRKHRMTMEELKTWVPVFEEAVKASKKKTPILYADPEHCRFCPASTLCPEISKNALSSAEADFNPESGKLVLPKTQFLTTTQLGKALSAFKLIEFWMAEVRAHAITTMQNGHAVPGWKVVDKRGVRKWNAPEATAKAAKSAFGKKAFTEPELLSPAQLEKLSPKAKSFVEKFSTNVSSGVTLAPESDKRSAVNQLEMDFGASH